MKDQELLQSISNNRKDAFELLVRRYYVPLCSFVHHIVQDEHSAEDIIQELFLKFWLNRLKLPSDLLVKEYLYTGARNAALNHIRSIKRRDSHHQKYATEDNLFFENYVIEEETNRLLYEALQKLPPRSAQIMQLTLEGLKMEKIAEDLSISIHTVKTLKYEALRKLRKSLETFIGLIFSCGLSSPKK